jgi:hypothetical protein
MMRKGIYWAIWIIAAVLAYKAAMWAYQGYQAGEKAQQQQILDIDKLCSVTADTGQCVCRHRQTNQRLSVPYEECVSRASDNR